MADDRDQGLVRKGEQSSAVGSPSFLGVLEHSVEFWSVVVTATTVSEKEENSAVEERTEEMAQPGYGPESLACIDIFRRRSSLH